MNRSPLRRWGKKGPWLQRYKEKLRARIARDGWPKRKGFGPRPKINTTGWKRVCGAEMLGKCYGPLEKDHIRPRGVRGSDGCDCRHNVPGYLCYGHHQMKHEIGRERFYKQHPHLKAMLDVANEHYRQRQQAGNPLPCSSKWVRRSL